MKSYLAPLFSLFLISNSYADTKEIQLPFIVNGNPYVGSMKFTEDTTSSTIYIDASNGQNKLSAKLVDSLNDGTVDYVEQSYKTKEKERITKRARMRMSSEERNGSDEWFSRLKNYVRNGLPFGIFEYSVDEE